MQRFFSTLIITGFLIFRVSNGFAGNSANNPSMDITEFNKIMDRIEETRTRIEVPAISDTRSEKAARENYKRFYSPEFQAHLENEQTRIQETYFQAYLPEKAAKSDEFQENADSEQLYVFISCSIPQETLRNYVRSVHTIGKTIGPQDITMILRGFMSGIASIMPTMNFISELLAENPRCNRVNAKCKVYDASIQIDPMKFREFNIERVPAVVYSRINSQIAENGNPITDTVTVFGDISLESALKKINGHARSAWIEYCIKTLQAGYYSYGWKKMDEGK